MNNITIKEKSDQFVSDVIHPTISSARESFVLNILSNGVYQAIYIAVTLWMTPFLISYLGIAAFGMIPLANTVTSYMGVLITAINLAISRFLAIEIGKGDNIAANKTFNTALFSLFGIILLLTPLAITVSIFFSKLFQIPLGWETDASWLFLMIVGAFFVSVVNGMFTLSPFIHSRFVLSNTVNLIGLLSRVGFVLIFFSVYRAHLWYAGGGILISALVSGLGYLILWRKLTPQLHIRFSYFDRARLGQLSGMGGWTFINQVGGMLLDRVDIVVVNAFFGAAITGAYGAVLQISVLVETVVSTISTVIRPVILLKYSQNDFIGLKYLAFRSVKLFGLALAVPVGLICGLARPLLIIWLGPSYAYLSILLIIVVCHMSLNLSVKPLNYIHNAYNRVKWPGLVLLLAGAASAGADIIIARYGNWGYLGIAASTGLIWTMKNVIFVPIYTSHIMKQPWWTYLPSLRWSIIGTLFVGLISYGLSVVYVPSNLLTLALMALLVSLIYSGIVWGFGLENSDKLLLLDLLPGKKLEGIRNLLIR